MCVSVPGCETAAGKGRALGFGLIFVPGGRARNGYRGHCCAGSAGAAVFGWSVLISTSSAAAAKLLFFLI